MVYGCLLNDLVKVNWLFFHALVLWSPLTALALGNPGERLISELFLGRERNSRGDWGWLGSSAHVKSW